MKKMALKALKPELLENGKVREKDALKTARFHLFDNSKTIMSS